MEGRKDHMTKLRKWRFPILIGSGIIAATGLVYFANGRIGTDKTQGAIGKRDVYRDGQVASADVATPGSAPVATQAILESSEFKALAKNQAFQELRSNSDFSALSTNVNFQSLMRNADFLKLAAAPGFADLVKSDLFARYLHGTVSRDSLLTQMQSSSHYSALAHENGMIMLLHNNAFADLARLGTFQAVLASQALRSALAESQVKNALLTGALSSLTVVGLHE